MTSWPQAKPYLYRGDPALAEANEKIMNARTPATPEARPDFTWDRRPFHLPGHGTRMRYRSGCRCVPCGEGNTRAQARAKARKAVQPITKGTS